MADRDSGNDRGQAAARRRLAAILPAEVVAKLPPPEPAQQDDELRRDYLERLAAEDLSRSRLTAIVPPELWTQMTPEERAETVANWHADVLAVYPDRAAAAHRTRVLWVSAAVLFVVLLLALATHY